MGWTAVRGATGAEVPALGTLGATACAGGAGGWSKGNRGLPPSASIAARSRSRFSVTMALAERLEPTRAAISFSRSRTGPVYPVTRSKISTATAAWPLAACDPATSTTLPAASRIPLRPSRATDVSATISSRKALNASVLMSSSCSKLLVLNMSSNPGSTPPPVASAVCANLASCMAWRILSAGQPFLAAWAATSRTTTSSSFTLPRATAFSKLNLPVAPCSKISCGKRERATPFSATPLVTSMLRRAISSPSMPMSRMILAASQAVPWPSAMFSMAPMARACSAVGASISQVKMVSTPDRRARSRRLWPLTTSSRPVSGSRQTLTILPNNGS